MNLSAALLAILLGIVQLLYNALCTSQNLYTSPEITNPSEQAEIAVALPISGTDRQSGGETFLNYDLTSMTDELFPVLPAALALHSSKQSAAEITTGFEVGGSAQELVLMFSASSR